MGTTANDRPNRYQEHLKQFIAENALMLGGLKMTLQLLFKTDLDLVAVLENDGAVVFEILASDERGKAILGKYGVSID